MKYNKPQIVHLDKDSINEIINVNAASSCFFYVGCPSEVYSSGGCGYFYDEGACEGHST